MAELEEEVLEYRGRRATRKEAGTCTQGAAQQQEAWRSVARLVRNGNSMLKSSAASSMRSTPRVSISTAPSFRERANSGGGAGANGGAPRLLQSALQRVGSQLSRGEGSRLQGLAGSASESSQVASEGSADWGTGTLQQQEQQAQLQLPASAQRQQQQQQQQPEAPPEPGGLAVASAPGRKQEQQAGGCSSGTSTGDDGAEGHALARVHSRAGRAAQGRSLLSMKERSGSACLDSPQLQEPPPGDPLPEGGSRGSLRAAAAGGGAADAGLGQLRPASAGGGWASGPSRAASPAARNKRSTRPPSAPASRAASPAPIAPPAADGGGAALARGPDARAAALLFPRPEEPLAGSAAMGSLVGPLCNVLPPGAEQWPAMMPPGFLMAHKALSEAIVRIHTRGLAEVQPALPAAAATAALAAASRQLLASALVGGGKGRLLGQGDEEGGGSGGGGEPRYTIIESITAHYGNAPGRSLHNGRRGGGGGVQGSAAGLQHHAAWSDAEGPVSRLLLSCQQYFAQDLKVLMFCLFLGSLPPELIAQLLPRPGKGGEPASGKAQGSGGGGTGEEGAAGEERGEGEGEGAAEELLCRWPSRAWPFFLQLLGCLRGLLGSSWRATCRAWAAPGGTLLPLQCVADLLGNVYNVQDLGELGELGAAFLELMVQGPTGPGLDLDLLLFMLVQQHLAGGCRGVRGCWGRRGGEEPRYLPAERPLLHSESWAAGLPPALQC
jgi:hypothetical protein